VLQLALCACRVAGAAHSTSSPGQVPSGTRHLASRCLAAITAAGLLPLPPRDCRSRSCDPRAQVDVGPPQRARAHGLLAGGWCGRGNGRRPQPHARWGLRCARAAPLTPPRRILSRLPPARRAVRRVDAAAARPGLPLGRDPPARVGPAPWRFMWPPPLHSEAMFWLLPSAVPLFSVHDLHKAASPLILYLRCFMRLLFVAQPPLCT
jgi:hypothetical protein